MIKNNDILFLDQEHLAFYQMLLQKFSMNAESNEFKALFYLVSLTATTRTHCDEILDGQDGGRPWIDCFSAPWQTGTSRRVLSLALNLYNGYNNYSPLDIFCNTTKINELLFQAIRIRFSVE